MIDLYMYNGAHKASAPVTNDTHVKPAEDNMKLLLSKETKSSNAIICLSSITS